MMFQSLFWTRWKRFFESTVAASPVVRSGISDEVAPTLPATSDQLRAIRVVAMDEGDTDTLVSADSRRGHDMEAALEARDPELRDVDDESHAPGDSSVDTESMDGREESVMGPEDHVPHVEEEDLELPLPRGAAVRDALIALDEVDPCRMFEQRASVMKGVPKFLRGPFRNALKFALQEATAQDVMRQTRGWKLFMMLPRMLLHRSPGGGHISKSKLEARFTLFNQGGWQELIRASVICDDQAAVSRRRRARRQGEDDLEQRAVRAEMFVYYGELSSARQALEGAALAPGNQATLNALTDASRRPAQPRDPLPEWLLNSVPEVRFQLDEDQLCRNLRSSRRGAAGGPSGMTTEHLRPLLSDIRGMRLLSALAPDWRLRTCLRLRFKWCVWAG